MLRKEAAMPEAKRVRVPDLKLRKQRGDKLVMLTAYDFTMARLLDRAGVDLLLVGDSLGMVVLGYETTLPVTLDAMVHHTAAVSRGAARALVVADMPFLSYQVSVAEAVRNAGRLLQEGGAAAVKIEGGAAVLEAAARLVKVGIPVMGHLGLVPQSVHQLGGFRQQAKLEGHAAQLLADAHALEAAGAFAVVLESIPAEVARAVTAELGIPTIGIGAGPYCDGQVLVSYDMLGLSEGPVPAFVERYADLGQQTVAAARAYAEDVRSAQFPPAKPRPASLAGAKA
jgi:3-methyl-2-oxobutanoate hydroxymethyltransferase